MLVQATAEPLTLAEHAGVVMRDSVRISDKLSLYLYELPAANRGITHPLGKLSGGVRGRCWT